MPAGREYNQAQLSDWYTRMLRDEILAEWRDTAAPVRGSSSSGAGSSSDGEGGGWRSAPQPSLHIYCHVSGEELWPAPPALRSFIFQVRAVATMLSVQGRGAVARPAGPGGWAALQAVLEWCPALACLPRPPAARRLAPPPPRSPHCCPPPPPHLPQREMTLVLDTIMHAERDILLAAVPALADAPVYVHLHSDIPALDRVLEWGRLGDRASWRSAQSSMLSTLLSSVLGTFDESDSDGSDGSWSRGAFSASSSWDGGAGGGAGLGTAGPGAVAWGGGSWDAGDHPQQQQAQQQPQQLGEQQQQPGVAPGSSSNGASAEHPAPGDSAACSASSNGSSSNGSSISSGSGSPAAANSAVSLASVQQAGDYPSWLGAAAVVADGRRRPAAEVVPAAVRARQR